MPRVRHLTSLVNIFIICNMKTCGIHNLLILFSLITYNIICLWINIILDKQWCHYLQSGFNTEFSWCGILESKTVYNLLWVAYVQCKYLSKKYFCVKGLVSLLLRKYIRNTLAREIPHSHFRNSVSIPDSTTTIHVPCYLVY